MKRILPLAVPAILFAACAAQGMAEETFAKGWFFPDRPKEVVALEGKALPEVDLAKADWTDGKAVTPKELAGNIVVIDVWATWCGPCRRALPHNAELAKERAKDGVLVVGLCADGDAAEMKKLQDKAGVAYPTAFAGKIAKQLDGQWHTPWFPYYIVVDRKGVVRGAGMSHEGAAKAVEALLKEQPAEAKAK